MWPTLQDPLYNATVNIYIFLGRDRRLVIRGKSLLAQISLSCPQEWGKDLSRGCMCLPFLFQPRGSPLSTHASTRDSWTLTGQSGSVSPGVTAFSWVLVHTRFCLCLPSLFPQSCGCSVIKSHWPSKSNSLGVLSPFAGSPAWDICYGP